MNAIRKLYRLLLGLYPPAFRARYGEEMEDVFLEAAGAARARAGLTGFLAREVVTLPASLAESYLWAMQSGEEPRMALSAAGGGGLNAGGVKPGRADPLLAALPYLLIGLLAGIPPLVRAANPDLILTGALGSLFPFFILIPALLFAVVYGLLKGWGRWSASWSTFLLVLPVALISILSQLFLDETSAIWIEHAIAVLQVLLLPLLLAWLLYRIARRDRTAGMLASIPPMVFVWAYFHEFVPALWVGLAWLWMSGLAFAAAVMIARMPRLNTALALVLAVPALGGFLAAVLGVYQGGTLPFIEPGPSLRVVLEQYLPFLAMSASLALGPQLAYQARSLGRQSAADGGKAGYRLALGGILLALTLAVLVYAVQFNGSQSLVLRYRAQFGTLFALSLVVFLAGFVLLLRAGLRSGVLLEDGREALRMAALLIALPGVPLVILFNLPGPVSDLLSQFFLMPVFSLAWLAAAVWAVKE